MGVLDARIIDAAGAALAGAEARGEMGLNATTREKQDNIGASGRRHYDRLHLHTDRNHSGLPGMAMPAAYPTYPSCTQVIEYLEDYAARFGIRPVFDAEVMRISRDGEWWRVDAGKSWSAPVVVIATAIPAFPSPPSSL